MPRSVSVRPKPSRRRAALPIVAAIAALACSQAFSRSPAAPPPPVPEPGGYQAGLTTLLRPAPEVRLWGPGIKTPPPGGGFQAALAGKPAAGEPAPGPAPLPPRR